MSALQLPAAVAAIVTIVVDGATVPSAPPAHLIAGRVVAPPALVARLSDRVRTFPDGGLTATRGERSCDALVRDDAVELAPLARCLGARVSWDATAKTLLLEFQEAAAVRTPAPFDPAAPQVAPTALFTPEPAPPTPRAIETGAPRPRRTAIPVSPSLPLPASTTGSRPRSL